MMIPLHVLNGIKHAMFVTNRSPTELQAGRPASQKHLLPIYCRVLVMRNSNLEGELLRTPSRPHLLKK